MADLYRAHNALRHRVFGALYPMPSSNFWLHVVREVQLAGLLNGSVKSDYNGAVGEIVLRVARVLDAEHMSGGLADMVIDVLGRVLNYETLTPNDHSLFRDVSAESGQPKGTVLQDLRDSRWISWDGGKTWKHVEVPDDKRKVGLFHKYKKIERTDGKPVNWAFVLEDKDPLIIPALRAYAEAAKSAGFGPLAADLLDKVRELEARHGVKPAE